MIMYREGKVFIQNELAGYIRESDSGFEFIYEPVYLDNENALPVSLTMPLRREAYVSNTMFPFFDGLIPEGWLLDIVEKNWKIDGNDRFGLLLVACGDCIGDVRIEA